MSNLEQFLLALVFTVFFMGVGKVVVEEVKKWFVYQTLKRQIKSGKIKIIFLELDDLENPETKVEAE